MKKLMFATLCAGVLLSTGCVTEGSRAIEPTKTDASATAATYRGAKSAIAVGKFDNKSSYQNGIFYSHSSKIRKVDTRFIRHNHIFFQNKFRSPVQHR